MSRAYSLSPWRGALLPSLLALPLLAATLVEAPPAAAGVDRWSPAAPPGVQVADLVLDPFEPRTGYAISNGPAASDAMAPTRLWRTTDAGASWVRWLPGLPAAASTLQVALDPHQAGRIYLATRAGLFVRERPGAAWRLRRPEEIDGLAFDAGTPGLLFAATDTSLSRSEDGGRTWTVTRRYSSGNRFTDLFSDPAMPGRVYASMRFPIIGGEGSAWLERSDDAGRTWRSVSDWSYSAPPFFLAPAADGAGSWHSRLLRSGSSLSREARATTWRRPRSSAPAPCSSATADSKLGSPGATPRAASGRPVRYLSRTPEAFSHSPVASGCSPRSTFWTSGPKGEGSASSPPLFFRWKRPSP